MYGVSFHGCRTVYPIKIIRPINKFKINQQEHLKQVLDDITDNGCVLSAAVGDNPKRSFFRCALGSGSCYGCEYCEGKAEYIVCKDKNGNKKGDILLGHVQQLMELQEL